LFLSSPEILSSLQLKNKKGRKRSAWSILFDKRPTMPLVTHSTVPAISASSARKPNRFMRMVHAVVEARTRMYLQAVTDPETGRIDPVLEQRVLHLMTL